MTCVALSINVHDFILVYTKLFFIDICLLDMVDDHRVHVAL